MPRHSEDIPKATHTRCDGYDHTPQMLQTILVYLAEIRDRLADAHKANYTVEEVAKLTRRSAYTVRRWISEKRIAAIRIEGGPRGRLLIPRVELEKLVESELGESVPDFLGSDPISVKHMQT